MSDAFGPADFHPDDVVFLDGVLFTSTEFRQFCDRCKRCAHTVVVGAVEAESGPGWDIGYCRVCVAVLLHRARLSAGTKAHIPALPSYG